MGFAEESGISFQQIPHRRHGSGGVGGVGLSVAGKERLGRRIVQYPEYKNCHARQARGKV